MKHEVVKILSAKPDNIFVSKVEELQSLWSGYGSIKRYTLSGGEQNTIIVKHVKLPDHQKHPRGWNTRHSHQRKIRSYEVETQWYKDFGQACDDLCRIAECFGTKREKDEFIIVLEDLDASGFTRRLEQATPNQMLPCIRWLAHFHARFLHHSHTGLWPTGTYWHLETRPDELEALDDPALKKAALEIDMKLRECPYQTLVHGDAKLANFCFSKDGQSVAAVDFQYVGGGCGMKDVAYFIGSCLDANACQRYAEELLQYYFDSLEEALNTSASSISFAALEESWRPMYAYAWADFHRFVKGWSPGHWKLHSYSEALTQGVLKELQSR
ncbi:MAG: choline kinase [Oleiphilus sp.]|nr:MAG: choline kinase [Oleiphilus sp.]